MLKLKQISDKVVKPIPKECIDKSKIIGSDVFSNPYGNIMTVASTNSGKTCAVFQILKSVTKPKYTKIIIIASTIYNDQNYSYIEKYLKENKYKYEMHTSIYDEETQENRLLNLLNELKQEAEERKYAEETNDDPEPTKYIVVDEDIEKQENKKERKPKKIAQKYLIILDDLSDELRKDKSLGILTKKSRHFQIRLIVSTQYLLDIDPMTRKQMYYALLFGGLGDDKIHTIYKDMDLSWLPYEKFKAIYEAVTEKKYRFLFIDRQSKELRLNFTHLIML